MSEVKKEDSRPWQSDYDWLSKRIDRLQTQMDEQCSAQAKRIRLLVRILVDKKIVGEEIAKSVEETFKKEESAVLDWFNKELEVLKKDLEETKSEK